MKLIDIITASRPSLSFEVFPPKTDTSFQNVKTATEEIAKLRPSYMSVTYGAGGGTSEHTIAIAENLKKLGVTPLAHLSCVSSTKTQIHEQLRKLKDCGIENCHPHRFRRTGATFALKRGMPIEQVSTILGHESIETTQIYLDISEDDVAMAHRKYAG